MGGSLGCVAAVGRGWEGGEFNVSACCHRWSVYADFNACAAGIDVAGSAWRPRLGAACRNSTRARHATRSGKSWPGKWTVGNAAAVCRERRMPASSGSHGMLRLASVAGKHERATESRKATESRRVQKSRRAQKSRRGGTLGPGSQRSSRSNHSTAPSKYEKSVAGVRPRRSLGIGVTRTTGQETGSRIRPVLSWLRSTFASVLPASWRRTAS